jgi:hypothetical protein
MRGHCVGHRPRQGDHVPGHPGLSKSQLALALMAIVTTGVRFLGYGFGPKRASAVILSAEDDPEDTIRPRLEAAQAELSRCHVIGMYATVATGARSDVASRSSRDLEASFRR